MRQSSPHKRGQMELVISVRKRWPRCHRNKHSSPNCHFLWGRRTSLFLQVSSVLCRCNSEFRLQSLPGNARRAHWKFYSDRICSSPGLQICHEHKPFDEMYIENCYWQLNLVYPQLLLGDKFSRLSELKKTAKDSSCTYMAMKTSLVYWSSVIACFSACKIKISDTARHSVTCSCLHIWIWCLSIEISISFSCLASLRITVYWSSIAVHGAV